MGLPDLDSASTWGGKLLVDRDGMEIGTCTQIFLDDATGLPEWAEADLSGGPGVVPLVDAAAAGELVRVAVRRAEVEDAPRVDDPLHISQDEEERLYRHYGITFSREGSDSLLPLEGPQHGSPAEAGAGDAEPVRTEPVAAAADATGPLAPATAPATPTSSTSPGLLESSSRNERRGLLTALAAGAVGVLAVVAAAVFWWRRQHQVPPTRTELLTARARGASLALGSKKDQLTLSAAPLLRTGRELSAAAAAQAAAQARVAADRAAVQAREAARQAAVLAATARGVKLQRQGRRAGGEAQADAGTTDGRHAREAVMSALQAFGGFATGYAVRARAGRTHAEESRRR